MVLTNGIFMSDNDQHRGGSPLKELREKLGLSQQIFATRLGVSIGSVGRWERGERSILLSLDQVEILIEMIQSVGWDMKEFFARAKEFELACTK
jgi:putative transcriptional regulator